MDLKSNFKIFLFVLLDYVGSGGDLVFWAVCLGFFVPLFVCGLVFSVFHTEEVLCRAPLSRAQNSFLGRMLL